MKKAKNFGFGSDQVMLRDSAIKFFRDYGGADKLHKLVAGNPSPERAPECLWNQNAWNQMVELGWTTLALPERCGGIGMGTVAVAALVEELGRAALPCPLVETINASYLLAACETEAADAVLNEIAAGKAVGMAITNKAGSWELADTNIQAQDATLNGSAYFVQNAKKVAGFVVKAKSDNGIGLYYVEASAAGLTIAPDSIVDLTRDQAQLHFDKVKATLIAASGSAEAALANAEPYWLTVLAADMVGAADWQMQTTIEYAKTREQFGHPIGFFQAVKHPIVNMMLKIDEAKSLLYNAAHALDTEPAMATTYARMAKSSAADTAVFCSNRSIQLHGGIGFTWECYLHLYFKRQMHNQMLYGDAKYQRAKLADSLIGPVAA